MSIYNDIMSLKRQIEMEEEREFSDLEHVNELKQKLFYLSIAQQLEGPIERAIDAAVLEHLPSAISKCANDVTLEVNAQYQNLFIDDIKRMDKRIKWLLFGVLGFGPLSFL